MVFLFVLEELKQCCGANINIAMNLSSALRNKGHKVYAVASYHKNCDICPEHFTNFDQVFPVWNSYLDLFSQFQQEQCWEEKSALAKAKAYITNPKILPMWYDSHYYGGLRSLKRAYINEIDKVISKYSIDVIMAFSCPHWTEEIVYHSRGAMKKGIFQLDPYIHLFFYDDRYDKRIKETERIQKRIDRTFVTRQILEEMKDERVRINYSKLCIYRFPGIRAGIKTVEKEEQNHNTEEKEKLDVYYIGKLYEDIRNPEFVLKLFLKLKDNIVLHIVGEGAEAIIDRYKEQFGKRLIVHGKVPLEEAFNLMNQADILLNINNAVKNLTPSKIFDYINTGRPIVNICKLRECPSIEYMEKYPLCHTIYEDDEMNGDMIGDLEKFMIEAAGKTVKREEILEKFYDCSDEYVANQIVEAF